MPDSRRLASPSLPNWLRRLLLIVGGVLVAGALTLVAGAFIPSVPYVGAFGSIALSLWPAWVVVVAASGGAIVWWTARGTIRSIFIGLSSLAAIGAVIVIYQLLAVARANGAEITMGNSFGFSQSLDTISPDEIQVYARDRGNPLTLRIYRSRGASGSHPVLLYVHGGGWVSGSSGQRSADMRWFADHGWVVVSIDYSLSTVDQHRWDTVTGEVGCAMAWTAAHIAARGGNARRLALIGDSAGGNLVINAAYQANEGTLRSGCGGRVPRVSSVVALYPGVDLAAIYRNQYRPTGPDVSSMVRRYIGGSPDQYPARYTSTASATYINRDAPPTLLFLTENDHLIPAESVRTFEAKARAGGVPVTTISVPFGEHVFDATGIGAVLVRQAGLHFMNRHDPARTIEKRPR